MSQFIKFYFTSSMFNMFQTLIHPSGACDFSIVSPHWLCVLVSMCVGIFLCGWLGWYPCGRLKLCFSLPHCFKRIYQDARSPERQICMKSHSVLFKIRRMVTFCKEGCTKRTNPLCVKVQFLNAGRSSSCCYNGNFKD